MPSEIAPELSKSPLATPLSRSSLKTKFRTAGRLAANTAKLAQSVLVADERRANERVFPIYFLGQPGFQAKLKGLTGPLTKFNGHLTFPEKNESTGMYTTEILGLNVILDLKPDQFDVVKDFNPDLSAAKKKKAKRKVSVAGEQLVLQNRTSVKASIEKLVSQIRLRAGDDPNDSKSPIEMFQAFAALSEGELNQSSFLGACTKLGVTITRKEVELIWPVLDADGSGSVFKLSFRLLPRSFHLLPRSGAIEVDEFEAFLRQAKFSENYAERQEMIHEATIQQRKTRIQLRSDYTSMISGKSTVFRDWLHNYKKQHHSSNEDLFRVFDFTGEGLLSLGELAVGLDKLGFDADEDELKLVWPILTRRGETDMTMEDWVKFMTGERNWMGVKPTDKLVDSVRDDMQKNSVLRAAPSMPSNQQWALGPMQPRTPRDRRESRMRLFDVRSKGERLGGIQKERISRKRAIMVRKLNSRGARRRPDGRHTHSRSGQGKNEGGSRSFYTDGRRELVKNRRPSVGTKEELTERHLERIRQKKLGYKHPTELSKQRIWHGPPARSCTPDCAPRQEVLKATTLNRIAVDTTLRASPTPPRTPRLSTRPAIFIRHRPYQVEHELVMRHEGTRSPPVPSPRAAFMPCSPGDRALTHMKEPLRPWSDAATARSEPRAWQ
jgi:Ca2+-binding EF-hand superfamily protein